MQCGTTLDATSTTTDGELPQATYTSQCDVLQNAGVSRDAHAQAITKKKLDPTFQGHNSSVHEEDGQKRRGDHSNTTIRQGKKAKD